MVWHILCYSLSVAPLKCDRANKNNNNKKIQLWERLLV